MKKINAYDSDSLEITDAILFECQKIFEKKLQDEIDFPDAIRGKDIYIYRNLMNVWFEKLSAKNRYDTEMTQKLRKDWIDYMQALEDRSTHNYLSFEFYDENDNTKSDGYRERCYLDNRKICFIEDAFTSEIGKDAVKELANIRAMDDEHFSRKGEKSPNGFIYDLGRKELVPVDNK
jgi:hypothetical protein